MAVPFIVNDVARSIYKYAGTDGLPNFEELPPTVQISYIEEAEAAISSICKHINLLATQVEPSEMQPFVVGVLMAVAETLKPNNVGL